MRSTKTSDPCAVAGSDASSTRPSPTTSVTNFKAISTWCPSMKSTTAAKMELKIGRAASPLSTLIDEAAKGKASRPATRNSQAPRTRPCGPSPSAPSLPTPSGRRCRTAARRASQVASKAAQQSTSSTSAVEGSAQTSERAMSAVCAPAEMPRPVCATNCKTSSAAEPVGSTARKGTETSQSVASKAMPRMADDKKAESERKRPVTTKKGL
mmetsp:Transcript_99675/g.280190  ORF Transcript_99675/g.280190 Transcript_99675/m.280190 type:complete len:211 (-) Transcript_99675:592-1224(-)